MSRYGAKDIFDPDNISQDDMDKIADVIEGYLSLYQEVLIIPEELQCKKEVLYENIRVVNNLIKKLRKGKKDDVFKDESEWDSFY